MPRNRSTAQRSEAKRKASAVVSVPAPQSYASYYVALEYVSGEVRHELAPSLFRQYVSQGFIIKQTEYRATVNPDYFAYLDLETNALRFSPRSDFARELAWLTGGSVALRYFLLWLYSRHVELVRKMPAVA